MAKSSLKSRVSAALKKSYNKKAAATVASRNSSKSSSTTNVVDRAKAMLGTAYNPNTKVTEPVNQTVDRAKAMLQQTQAEGSTPFAGSSFEKTYLAKYPAPTDASMVGTPFPPLNTPALGPDMGNISDAVAGNKGLEAMLALQQKQADERMKMEQQRQKEQKGLLDKFMGSVTSPWQAREEAMKETGIDPSEYFAQQEKGIKEIESLTNDYNKVIEAKDAQIAATQDKMGSMNFINNQTAQIERNAAPQLNRLSANINAKAATLQALQGNFAEARSYINQAVQDATADTKFKYDMMKMVYDMNEDSFDRVDSIYSDAYKGAMAIAEMQYQEDLSNKKILGQLLLENPQAGINIYSDSLEDAYAKVQASPMSPSRRLLEAQIANTWSNATSTTTGGGGTGVADSAEVAGDGGRLSELFNLVVGSAGSVTETKRQIAQFNEYLNDGNVEAAQQMVNTLAVKNMTAEQRNKFIGFGSISSAVDSVSQIANEFAQTNPGLYRTILESAKPFVGASTDPAWQSFVAQTQNAINAYRNEIFGASLTGNELKAANISLPDWNRDTANTIFTKLAAMKTYADTVRESAIRNTTGQYTSSALGQTPTAQSVIQSTSVYDETTGQQSDGGWFSKFISWFR